jgi:hypothetical protein
VNGLITGRIDAVCSLAPDPGRLTNQFWVYVARDCTLDSHWIPEPQTRAFAVGEDGLHELASSGHLYNAAYVALYAPAMARGSRGPGPS